MTGMPLAELLGQYRAVEDALIESGGEITTDIEAMIASVSACIGEKLDGYAGFVAWCRGQAAYLKAEAEQYASRARTLTAAVDSMRERMVYAMQTIGEEKVKTAKHSYSLRVTESWSVDEGLFSARDLDGLIAKGLAERTYKVDIAGLKKDVATGGGDVPEYIAVTSRTSITIR